MALTTLDSLLDLSVRPPTTARSVCEQWSLATSLGTVNGMRTQAARILLEVASTVVLAGATQNDVEGR